MTHISPAQVQHLAQLSRLQLSEEEATRLGSELESIVAYFDQLNELDTDGVEPTYQVTDLQNVWRTDTVDTFGITPDALLAAAPDRQSDSIKVPKVL